MSGHRFVSVRDLSSRFGHADTEAPSAFTASRDEFRAREFAVEPEPDEIEARLAALDAERPTND